MFFFAAHLPPQQGGTTDEKFAHYFFHNPNGGGRALLHYNELSLVVDDFFQRILGEILQVGYSFRFLFLNFIRIPAIIN